MSLHLQLVSYKYCKMFNILIDRDIPDIYLRLLFNLYTVSWNGVCSQSSPFRMALDKVGNLVQFYFVHKHMVYCDGCLNPVSPVA